MEEVDYNTMRYELDKEGYIFQVYFGCASGTCQAYEGNVPDGYETLEEWYEENCNNLRAWRIVNGNLACDSGKEEELQSCYEQEAIDNSLVKHKELYGLQKELEDIQELNSTQYTKATAQGKIIELNNVKRVVPKIKVSNINPYDYGKIDILANKKNMLPNDGVSQNIKDLEINKNRDGSITLNGIANSTNLINNVTSYTWASNGKIAVIEKIDNYIKVSYPEGSELSNNYHGTYSNDIREGLDYLVGQKCTFSFYAKADTPREITAQAVGDIKSYTISLGTEWQRYSIDNYTYASGRSAYFYCGADKEISTFYIKDIMLETGSELSDYEPYGTPIDYNLVGDSENTTPIFAFKKDVDYYLSTNNMNLKMYNYNGIDRELVFEGTNGSLSFDEDKLVTYVTLSIPTNTTFEDLTIYPMLNYGLTAMEYEKYEVEKLLLNFSEYVEEGLFPSDELYPSDELFPYGTSIEYILAEASGNTASINGEETYLEEDGKITLFNGYNVIYSLQDVQIDVEYCINNLALEGTVTKNNNFEVLDDGSIKAHNGYFSGTIEANDGTIGGWDLDETGFSNGNFYIKKNGYSNIYVTSDIYIIQMIGSGIIPIPSGELFKHYDVNNDGVIDVKDMLIIQNMIMGKE